MDNSPRRPWPAIVYALVLLTITTLPYLIGWSQQNESWRFSGFLFGVEDGQSYIAKMRQGAAGELAFTLPYTSEPHPPAPGLFMHYILPGWAVGRFVPETSPGLTPALLLAFHTLRLAVATVYLWVLYRFISAFVLTAGLRLLAFVLATIGGGFGWLLAITQGIIPPEFYLPEGFGFLGLWGLPHLLVARSLLLIGLLFLARATETGRWWPAAWAGLCWAGMGLVVPFYPITALALLAAWAGIIWIRARLFPGRFVKRAMLAAALALPVPAYVALTFLSNPAMSVWSSQSPLPTPPPSELAMAYLPLLIPAATALPFVWASAWDKGRLALLLAWVLVAPLLAYAPISVQRRLLESVIVPLSILAAIGLAGWARHGRAGRFAAGGMIALSSLSVVILVLGSLTSLSQTTTPLFRPASETAALDWLNTHAPAHAVVLGAFESGNVVPVHTRLRPFVGHGPETIAAIEKTALVRAFFADAMTPAEREALLAGPCLAPNSVGCSDPIDFVLFGPLEQAIAGNTTPGRWSEGLTRIYETGGYQIFSVTATEP